MFKNCGPAGDFNARMNKWYAKCTYNKLEIVFNASYDNSNIKVSNMKLYRETHLL